MSFLVLLGSVSSSVCLQVALCPTQAAVCVTDVELTMSIGSKAFQFYVVRLQTLATSGHFYDLTFAR
jgi:hypothetical protein